MKVRLLGNVKYEKQVHKAGSILSMDENAFKGLNQLGLVEVIEEAKPKGRGKAKAKEEVLEEGFEEAPEAIEIEADAFEQDSE